ncbi:MAG: TauD/TfdA family dioxygenase [Marmoricola sp.]|nr:TauD/TfdA family dioxygenase [Marmoricola sp.]
MSSHVVADRVTVAVVDGDLWLRADERSVEVSAVWLRDQATDAASRDPVSGQRLFSIADLPVDLRVDTAQVTAGRLEVVFAPDGHRTTYDVEGLVSLATAAPRDWRNESAKHLWRTGAELGALTATRWVDYLEDRAPSLRSVVERGFALLSEVPAREGQVTEAVETFGFVRETNYGRIFDVRVEERASNLAFTGLAISPHTDNPYRDPVPTLQLLHCLTNAATGGDSGLVDGFAAAAHLREIDPRAFDVLTSTPVSYRFDSAAAHLEAHAPLIGLDGAGRIREVRFNNRSMQVPAMERDRADAFYAAYRAFATLLFDPAAQVGFRMGPGDCLVFDNTRLLHARTAFEAVGGRHLQGTYADLDGLLSTLATLEQAR